MARADFINKLYSANKTPLEFKFDSLIAPPLLSLLSPYDIKLLNDVARDPKLSSKINRKLDIVKNILNPRGFVKFHSGTNRVVYRFLEDQSFLIKIALNRGGLPDNPDEFRNQFLLAPFVTKVFETSPCGTVGLFERVEPITSRLEFTSIADDVFTLLNDKFIGKYVMEDIGAEYFMNWGVRLGFGPVLLDFPYCYELDGNKIYCNAINTITGQTCGGSIDYDDGFNNLVCTKCGAKVFARDLEKSKDNKKIIIKKKKGRSNMVIEVMRPNRESKVVDNSHTAKTYADAINRRRNVSYEEEVKVDNTPTYNEEQGDLAVSVERPKRNQEEEVKKPLEESNESLDNIDNKPEEPKFKAEIERIIRERENSEVNIDPLSYTSILEYYSDVFDIMDLDQMSPIEIFALKYCIYLDVAEVEEEESEEEEESTDSNDDTESKLPEDMEIRNNTRHEPQVKASAPYGIPDQYESTDSDLLPVGIADPAMLDTDIIDIMTYDDTIDYDEV